MTSWTDNLDERGQKEVELARLYAREFAHGTDGHGRLMLIDQLAGMLDRFSAASNPPAPDRILEFVLLDVPYHSQHEADAQWFRKDCGPACVEMIGKSFNPNAPVTTNEIMKHITAGVDRGVYVRELQAACGHFFDVDLDRYDPTDWRALKGWLEDGRPVIVLVHYGSFGMRIDRSYTAGHFMVVVGYDVIDYQGERVERAIVHDPDFYGDMQSQGAFLPVTQDHFVGMWEDSYKDSNPRRLALVPRVG